MINDAKSRSDEFMDMQKLEQQELQNDRKILNDSIKEEIRELLTQLQSEIANLETCDGRIEIIFDEL